MTSIEMLVGNRMKSRARAHTHTKKHQHHIESKRKRIESKERGKKANGTSLIWSIPLLIGRRSACGLKLAHIH